MICAANRLSAFRFGFRCRSNLSLSNPEPLWRMHYAIHLYRNLLYRLNPLGDGFGFNIGPAEFLFEHVRLTPFKTKSTSSQIRP